MTELKQGTKVRIIVEGTVSYPAEVVRGEYDNIWLDEGPNLESIPEGAVEVLDPPTPVIPETRGTLVLVSYRGDDEPSGKWFRASDKWVSMIGKEYTHDEFVEFLKGFDYKVAE